jgi:hypothetical protein
MSGEQATAKANAGILRCAQNDKPHFVSNDKQYFVANFRTGH